MDVIAVNQAGIQNAVATLGTALTSEQALLMKRYADEVIICYDADEAGQKATQRAIELLRNAGLSIKVISIPQGKDPDEFLRGKGDKGGQAFRNVIERSGNDIEYRLSKAKSKFNMEASEDKVSYLNEAVKILATLDNAVEQEVYASKLSAEIGVSKEAVMQQLKKQVSKRYKEKRTKEFRGIQSRLNGRDDKVNTDRYQKPRVTAAEEALIAYIIKHPDRISYVNSKLSDDKFQTAFNKKLYIYIRDRIKEGKDPLTTVSGDFTTEEAAKIYQIANSYSTQIATDKSMQEYIDVINDEFLKYKTKDAGNASMEDIQERLRRLKDNHQ